MIDLAFKVISWIARWPKSTTFSGCPKAHAASNGEAWWPVSVLAAAYPWRTSPARLSNATYPARTPLPTPRYWPFQPEVGIQTSILMSESLDGFTCAVTRQKAGTFLKSRGPYAAGSVNAPACTTWANVIVVSGSASVARLSQVAEANGHEKNQILSSTAQNATQASGGPTCISWTGRDPSRLLRFTQVYMRIQESSAFRKVIGTSTRMLVMFFCGVPTSRVIAKSRDRRTDGRIGLAVHPLQLHEMLSAEFSGSRSFWRRHISELRE